MTTITLKINERTKAGKAFLAMAETFLKDVNGIEIIETASDELSSSQKKWINGLKKVSKDLKSGTFKGQSAQSFLDEL